MEANAHLLTEKERHLIETGKLTAPVGFIDDFKKWAARLNRYLEKVHSYFWPELIILGGGGSKKFEKLAPYLSAPCSIVPAKLRNQAGIIGAALVAENVAQYQQFVDQQLAERLQEQLGPLPRRHPQ